MGDALAPACGEEGTSGEVLASSSEAAEYDLAARPEGHDVTRIQHAVQAIRTAYFGTGGVYASRVSAELERSLLQMPNGVAAAQAMLKTISDSVSRAKLEQTVATLGAWSKAHRKRERGLVTLEVEREDASGRLVLLGSKIAGMNPSMARTLSDRGATVKDVVTAKEAMEVKVTVGGSVSFTLPSGLLGEPRLPPDHIVPSFFREHGRRYFGMGPNADPQLAASIAVHRDLLGASL